jgi:hypothetical protein
LGGDVAGGAEGFEVSEEAEAGDVGGGIDESLFGESHAGSVEGGHEAHGLVDERLFGEASFDGGGNDAGTEWFRQEEDVAGLGGGVGDDAAWVDHAGYGEAIDGLRIFDGMAAGEGALGFLGFGGATLEDFVDDLVADEVDGHADDGEGGEGLAAHGVDVGERIGGGDLAVKVWVVDDGGEEVDGLDEGAFIVETIDSRVVGGGTTDD